MTNMDLVKNLKEEGVLRTPIIVNAFNAVDRADFVEEDYVKDAYVNNALPIGHGQTISQPSTVAFMLEKLQPGLGQKLLDVGSGSGWTTALLAEIVGKEGRVIGVEKIPELVKFGSLNLSKYDYKNARIVQAASSLGFPENGPYDRILVSATTESIPQELLDQLKPGGILVIPVINSVLKVFKINETEVKTEEYFGFAFVPLVKDSI